MARPVGVKETQPRNTAARKQASELAEAGITPLEVLLTAMRRSWDKAEAAFAEKDEGTAGRHEERACVLAEKAAPYLHAKLAASTVAIAGADGGPVEIEVIRRVIIDPGHSNP